MLSRAVIYHAVSMTLILFIACPILLYHFSQKNPVNEFRFKVCQIIITVITITAGCYASFDFANHTEIHSALGLLIICIILPIWTLFQHVESLPMCCLPPKRLQSAREWLFLSLLLFVLPTQWMLGIEYVTYEGVGYPHGVALEKFLGHYWPGYCFMASGVGIMWSSNNMESVMKGEMYVLGPAAAVAMAGEIKFSKGVNMHLWHHTILESCAILMSILMIIMYRLKIEKRQLLHGLCMTTFWGLYGWMMLSHQNNNDLNEMMHKLTGVANLAVAFSRIRCIYEDSSKTMIYGYLLFMGGFIFNFANVCIANFWDKTLGYPGMAYMAIIIIFGTYLATVSGIFQQLMNGKDSKVEKESKWEDESTPFLVDTGAGFATSTMPQNAECEMKGVI